MWSTALPPPPPTPITLICVPWLNSSTRSFRWSWGCSCLSMHCRGCLPKIDCCLTADASAARICHRAGRRPGAPNQSHAGSWSEVPTMKSFENGRTRSSPSRSSGRHLEAAQARQARSSNRPMTVARGWATMSASARNTWQPRRTGFKDVLAQLHHARHDALPPVSTMPDDSTSS